MPKALFWSALLAVTVLAFIPSYAPLPGAFSASDILNHFAAFFTLSILFGPAYPATSPRTRAAVLLAYGIWIETVQAFLPAREASLGDVAADAAGILAALAMHFILRRFNTASV